MTLELWHKLGKVVQSCQRASNNETRLKTRPLFVGAQLWQLGLRPFLHEFLDEERKGSTTRFYARSTQELSTLLPLEFHEVSWPNRTPPRANRILCDTAHPFELYFNSTTGMLRATFSCVAEMVRQQLDGVQRDVMVRPGQRVFN